MKKLLVFCLLFYTTLFYGQIQSYYNGLDFNKTGNDLFLELATRLNSTHTGLPYSSSSTDTWDVLKQVDQDPENSENVLLIYGYDDNDGISRTDRSRLKSETDTGGGDLGKWNREHVFAKSLANPSLSTETPGPGTDVHNLRPADAQQNSQRSNRKFTTGSGNSGIDSGNGGWYPGDEWKGDVARIVMYMYLRYNGDGSQISETQCLPINVGFGTTLAVDSHMIELFLQWNVEDPVSDFENQRNDYIEGVQGNRNPFIDNPYLATIIWGGLEAEDKWNMNNSSDTEAPTVPANLIATTITDESIDMSWAASTDNVGVYDYSVYLDGVYLQSTLTTSTLIENLESATSYGITIKARDISSNYSEFSNVLNVSTLEGPNILFEEDFEDCSNLKFVTYNEASTKNWSCETQYGENNSGSIGINGYQQAVLSKDWLITSSTIDFDVENGEELSFYTDAAFGTTPLELLYSSDYNGSGNPSDFTWISVPNVSIPQHSDGSGNEEVYTFSHVDISSISGAVYMAFKYYSDNEPTRWTVDNFEIIAEDENPDNDGDGVLNEDDLCPNTPTGETVDVNGCSNGQLDDDNDGIQNSDDTCANTPTGEQVNASGCSESQIDDDNDGVMNNVDTCPNTPTGETVDVNGCSNGQLDDDNDGIQNSDDTCADTPTGEEIDASGCSDSQLDDDNDGVMNNVDTCPNTPTGETPDVNGCSNGQLDDDNDGIQNSDDTCADTPTGEQVNASGCSESQIDDDNDGIMNNADLCSNTPAGESVDADGCAESQKDDDNDGVNNAIDQCPNTTVGSTIDANGCFTLGANNFTIEATGETCPEKDNGQLVITASENHNYSTTIDGTVYNFTTGLTVGDLAPDSYEFCITVTGETYEQCYTISIAEGASVSGKTSVTSKKVSIEITEGTAPYDVFVNGNSVLRTQSSLFSLEVGHDDVVEVKTAVDCEGVFSKTIELFDAIIAYPNPTQGAFEIALPITQKEVLVELYTVQSQLISVKTYPVVYGKVQLNLKSKPAGIYIVKVHLDKPVVLKIVKE